MQRKTEILTKVLAIVTLAVLLAGPGTAMAHERDKDRDRDHDRDRGRPAYSHHGSFSAQTHFLPYRTYRPAYLAGWRCFTPTVYTYSYPVRTTYYTAGCVSVPPYSPALLTYSPVYQTYPATYATTYSTCTAGQTYTTYPVYTPYTAVVGSISITIRID